MDIILLEKFSVRVFCPRPPVSVEDEECGGSHDIADEVISWIFYFYFVLFYFILYVERVEATFRSPIPTVFCQHLN